MEKNLLKKEDFKASHYYDAARNVPFCSADYGRVPVRCPFILS